MRSKQAEGRGRRRASKEIRRRVPAVVTDAAWSESFELLLAMTVTSSCAGFIAFEVAMRYVKVACDVTVFKFLLLAYSS